MLFDLEDYINAQIIGTNQLQANEIYWVDSYMTANSVRDWHFIQVRRYFEAAINFVSLEQRPTVIEKWDIWTAATFALAPIWKNYWKAIVAIPVQGLFNDGDYYAMSTVPAYSSEGVLVDHSGEEYIVIGEPRRNFWQPDSWENYYIWTAQYTGESDSWEYATFTQELQDQYGAAIEAVMLAEKELVLALEGPDFLQDYQP